MEQLQMTPERIREIADSFKIRCSAILDIMAPMGLTDKQAEILAVHEKRRADATQKPLTDKMEAERLALIGKRDNPELPDGAKTHCKKWLKERLWKRRGEVRSKYIDKGNLEEESGFTVMAVQLNLGMVYKNTQLRQNEYIIGTDDLFAKSIVYDNKCSYTLDTFPMFETEIPDAKYEWQVSVGYCDLRNCDTGVVAYTLVDAPIEVIEREIKWIASANDIYKKLMELVYTKEKFDALVEQFCPTATFDYFVEIPEEDRIVTFTFPKNKERIASVYNRVSMCRDYIFNLLLNKYKLNTNNENHG